MHQTKTKRPEWSIQDAINPENLRNWQKQLTTLHKTDIDQAIQSALALYDEFGNKRPFFTFKAQNPFDATLIGTTAFLVMQEIAVPPQAQDKMKYYLLENLKHQNVKNIMEGMNKALPQTLPG